MDPRQRLLAVCTALDSLNATIDAAGGAPTADQQTQLDALLEEGKTLKAKIAVLDAQASRRTEAAALRAATANPGRQVAPNGGSGDGSTPAARAEPGTIHAELALLKDPKRGYRDVRSLLGDLRVCARTGRLSDGVKALTPDRSYYDSDMRDAQAAAGSDEHSTFDFGSLGVMVPQQLMPGVMTTPAPDDPFPDTMKVNLTGGSVEIVARVDKNHAASVSGGLRVYRRAESQPGTPSRMQAEKITLRADPVMGVTYDTEELLQDAPGVALAMIEAGFRDEFTAKRTQEILTGTGAGENLGWFNAALVLIDVDKEAGQAADSIVYDNLVKMLARGWNCTRWTANRTCIPSLSKMNAGTNGLVWQPSAREGLPSILLGLPIVFTEFCPPIGDVGDIILTNNSQYIETIRQDVKTEESIHVRFLENERTFRFTQRRGGAPWWRSKMTPKNGDPLSPIVRLAAR